MIQRIQTIFLILVALCGVSLYFTSQDVVVVESNLWTLVLSWVVIVLSVASIFGYKNRKRQILFNNLNIFINALLIVLLAYWLLNLSGGIAFPEKGIELIFPIVSVCCLLMANIYIRKDERLVKSVDRLR